MTTQAKPTSVHLPQELRDRVKQCAVLKTRSFSGQLRVLLEEAFRYIALAGLEFPEEAAKLSARLWGAPAEEDPVAAAVGVLARSGLGEAEIVEALRGTLEQAGPHGRVEAPAACSR